jgi:hypothetical protein
VICADFLAFLGTQAPFISRHLYLTQAGDALETELSEAQRARMRTAYRAAGPEAVAGFRQVLEAMMDPGQRHQYNLFKEGGQP